LLAAFSDGCAIGSGLDGGRDLPIIRRSVDPAINGQIEDLGRDPLHPTLLRLSAILGREAAAFARRYRYAGLGRIQLILLSSDEP
jgi:hypothetical protein